MQVIMKEEPTGSGVMSITYEIYDPITKKSYEARGDGKKSVTMTEKGKSNWREDREKLPPAKRFEGLPIPPKKTKETSKEESGDGDACFSADTQVLMADGRSLAISRVREGDIVKSFNTKPLFLKKEFRLCNASRVFCFQVTVSRLP